MRFARFAKIPILIHEKNLPLYGCSGVEILKFPSEDLRPSTSSLTHNTQIWNMRWVRRRMKMKYNMKCEKGEHWIDLLKKKKKKKTRQSPYSLYSRFQTCACAKTLPTTRAHPPKISLSALIVEHGRIRFVDVARSSLQLLAGVFSFHVFSFLPPFHSPESRSGSRPYFDFLRISW